MPISSVRVFRVDAGQRQDQRRGGTAVADEEPPEGGINPRPDVQGEDE